MWNDKLGDRMKRYENITRDYLPNRMPVIIRLDGKAFHTFTRGFNKPFDDLLIEAMQNTALYLCEHIEGVKLAYTQSDEISLLLTNDNTWETEPWFSNNIQKMVSVAASMATFAFNRTFEHLANMYAAGINPFDEMPEIQKKLYVSYGRAATYGAFFDARVFVLPKEEVCNYFWWRQADAQRNSIQMCGQAHFSHQELHKKSCEDIKHMLSEGDCNWDWEILPPMYKWGSCVIKRPKVVATNIDFVDGVSVDKVRNKWVVDTDIPLFFQNREYIDTLLEVHNEK